MITACSGVHRILRGKKSRPQSLSEGGHVPKYPQLCTKHLVGLYVSAGDIAGDMTMQKLIQESFSVGDVRGCIGFNTHLHFWGGDCS